jgi:uncharacterized protein (TIGR02646 family)
MIHVTRDRTPPQLDVFTKNTTMAPDGRKKPKAQAETEKMISFFSNPKHFKNDKKITKKNNPKFTAYKDDQLVRMLLKIFHEKCTYCESRFPATSNEDIEHFRPKGRIDSDNGKLVPGYYWIGADWNNLLVSCSLCNRRQYHHTPDGADEVKLGKEDLFPLSDEAKRIRNHLKDIKDEEPVRLLINPCIEPHPGKFFKFDADGKISPATKSGRSHDMAAASIETYALQRLPLVEDRAQEYKEVIRQFRRIRDRLDDLNTAENSGNARECTIAQEELDFEMDALRDLFKRGSPFLAMKRQLMQAALDKGDFGDVSAAGIDLTLLLTDFT